MFGLGWIPLLAGILVVILILWLVYRRARRKEQLEELSPPEGATVILQNVDFLDGIFATMMAVAVLLLLAEILRIL